MCVSVAGTILHTYSTQALAFDEDTQLLSWQHHDVVEIHKRRYMLKDNALEIFLINGVTTLLAFESVHVC